MQSKRCRKCGETKASSEFHRNGTGLRSYCKECASAYARTYREAHREEHLSSQRAYREAHREARRAYYRAYREEHREERNAQCRNLKTEARDASREVATRNREPWTPAEDKVVLASEGTMLEIAIELGRTTSSVQNRRKRLRSKAVAA